LREVNDPPPRAGAREKIGTGDPHGMPPRGAEGACANKGESSMPKWNAPQAEPKNEPSRDEVIEQIVRKIHTLVGLHLKCREPICRRVRRCAGPDLRCDRDFPAPECTDAEWARIKGDFYDALKKRAAELGDQEEEAEESAVNARSRGIGPRVSARSRGPYPCKASPDRAPSRRRGAPT
jgi:hypothetical protein